MPGSEPRSRSSRVGLVAAVIAIESPSQPSPLVIQSTCSGPRLRRARHAPVAIWSASGPVWGSSRVVRSISDSRCSSSVPCRCQSPAAPVTRPGARQPRQRVGDRRPLGGHQLAEQPVGERQADADARRLDPSPAGGQVPEQQHQPHLQPRLAGDRTDRVEVVGPALGTAQQRVGDLRPGQHPLRRTRRRAARTASAAAPARPTSRSIMSSTRTPSGLQQVAGAEQLGDGAVDDPGVHGHQAVEDQQPRALAGRVEPRPEVARRRRCASSTRAVATCRAADPHADVELLGQVVVGVEDIRVQRRRLGPLGAGGARPP